MNNQKYVIKQFINDTFISKIELFSNEQDIKALKQLILLPQKNELVEEYYMVKVQVQDKTGLKSYFNFAVSKEKNDKDIHNTFISRYFNVQIYKSVILDMRLTNKTYKNYLYKIKKGKEYEQFIYSLFLKKKYKLIHNCLELKEKDRGIDFVAVKENIMILVQCKNWTEFQIEHSHLKEFYANCQIYLSQKDTKNYSIRLLFLSSKDMLSSSGKEFIKENKNLVEYYVIPIKP